LIRVAVIGFGHWGPNLARNLALAAGAELVAVCDIDPARLALALQQHPGVCTTTVALDVIQRADIDAVVIATPVHRHFDISLAALRAGKHVLVTKPMTETSAQALRLIEEAANRRLVLLVDHTFVYTAAVRRMRDLIAAGQLGEFHYYEATRVNLRRCPAGGGQRDGYRPRRGRAGKPRPSHLVSAAAGDGPDHRQLARPGEASAGPHRRQPQNVRL
jgi:predicted dehydrogenase